MTIRFYLGYCFWWGVLFLALIALSGLLLMCLDAVEGAS